MSTDQTKETTRATQVKDTRREYRAALLARADEVVQKRTDLIIEVLREIVEGGVGRHCSTILETLSSQLEGHPLCDDYRALNSEWRKLNDALEHIAEYVST